MASVRYALGFVPGSVDWALFALLVAALVAIAALYTFLRRRVSLAADSDSPGPVELDQIQEDHHHLSDRLASIEQVLLDLAGGGEADATSHRTRGALSLTDDLARKLQEHFAMEERGGYLAPALQASPDQKSQAKILAGEHASLAERLEEVRQAARSATRSEGWQNVADAFTIFCQALRAHERAETRLIRGNSTDESQDEG